MSSPIHSLATVSRLPGSSTQSRPPLHLILPGVLVAGAMLLPLVYLILRASRVSGAAWEQLLQARMVGILGNSLFLAAAVTMSAVLIAVPLAWLTVRTNLPGRRIWSLVTTLPLVIPSYVGAFAFTAAFGPRGAIHHVLAEPLGIRRLPDIYGFPGAWLTLTLFAYPYVLLTIRSALIGLDPAQEEAARSLGDSAWQVFRRVTLPQLRPSLAAGALLVALYVLSDFGAVSMMRYTTFTRAIYIQYRASFDRSLAALLALVLVLITLLLLAIEARVQGKARLYSRRSGSGRPLTAELGRWKWPALIFCALVTAAALGVPLGIIVYWLVRGLQSGETIVLWLGPAWRSVAVSSGAAILALFGALPVALMVERYPSRFSKLIERMSYIGYALPGIVVALALVFFGANFATPLYQTFAMLVFAYTVRYLPQATGSLRATVRQISPRLEEAARSLGSYTPGVLFRVTIPLVRRGLVSGGALVFLTSMKELPATLLLAPTGFSTLATRVWGATEEAFYARAAAPALMLVVVSALSIAFILGPEEGRH